MDFGLQFGSRRFWFTSRDLIFVSSFEANVPASLLHQLREPSLTTTLRLLLPRIRRNQSIVINDLALKIPPSITSFLVPIESLAAMFVFNGTLYFDNDLEQTDFCHFLGACPKPRTQSEEKAFHDHWIAIDGFVEDKLHRD